MRIQLEPTTEAGQKATAIAESHIATFAERADEFDRAGRFVAENFKDLYASGYMSAAVPEELGGLGLTSGLDMAIGTNRLARGCGSTALASNMARGGVTALAGQWRMARAMNNAGQAEGVERLLKGVIAGSLGFCGANSEAGNDPLHPKTEVTRHDDRWVLNGHKDFATASPAATHLLVMAGWEGDGSGKRLMYATVPTAAPGVTVNDDWDAMGMRGTGSPSVDFEGVQLPSAAVRDSGTYGEWDPRSVLFIFLGTGGGQGQSAAFLGIAEAAQDYVVERVTAQRKGSRPLADRSAVQMLIAENEISLSASVALVQTFGEKQEGDLQRIRMSGDVSGMHEVQKQAQIARRFTTDSAVAVVDRAMTVMGGGGYVSSSPLSRMYRDVRAGPVMPMSPVDVYEYIGKVTLGIEPDIWI